MTSKSALTLEESEKLLRLNREDGFALDRARLHSRKFDRIPVLPKHGITLRNSDTQICDEVEFIDASPISLRIRFPLELWMDGTLSIEQHKHHHSISRGRVLNVHKNQIDAVFLVTPKLRIE